MHRQRDLHRIESKGLKDWESRWTSPHRITPAIKKLVNSLIEEARQQAIEDNEIDFTKRMEQVARDVRQELVEEIRKWTKGKNVTKDSLRAFLNSLRKK